MIKTDLKNVMTGIVSQVLHGQHRTTNWHKDFSMTHPGLLFEVEMSVRKRDDMESELRRWFYVAFCGNTSVFYTSAQDADGNFRQFEEIPSEEWENTSNHDSCWRSDGLHWLTTEYFDMCTQVESDSAPRDLESSARLGLVSLWRNVEMHTKRRNNDDYRNVLLSIKRV